MSLYKMLFEDPNTKKYTALGGSIVIVIAMAGIFMHEAEAYKGEIINLEDIQIGGFGTSTFAIEWPESGPDTSTWAESNDVSVNYDLTHGNLTKVMITLLWTDDEVIQDPLRADRLSLTVTPPGLEVLSGDSTSGQVSLDYTVNQPPAKVEGLSGGEIEENLQAHDDVNGKGTWTFTVDVQPEGFRDSGNSWNLEFTYYWYEANVMEEEQE